MYTTDSNHALPISPNVLNRQFEPTERIQTWVACMTCIRTRSGRLYLAVVLDLFARKVVGGAMAPDMQAALVSRALQLVIVQRQPAAGLIVHSDRGSRYASAAGQAGPGRQQEPPRKLLGQRGDGALLTEPEDRARLAARLCQSC